MKKIFVFVVLLGLSCFALTGKIIHLPDLKKPDNIIMDQNELLITEFPLVYIYSKKDLKLIGKFGNKGEGPQEFNFYVRVYPHPDFPNNIVAMSHLKMSFFSRTGAFEKEIRLIGAGYQNIVKPLGKGIYVSAGFIQENKKVGFMTLKYLDDKLNKVKEVKAWKALIQQGKDFHFAHRDLFGGEFRVYDNKVFILIREEGKIRVMDNTGKELYVINHKYGKVPITDEDEQKFHALYDNVKDRRRDFYNRYKPFMKFYDHFPASRVFHVADGKIYVLTYKQKDGKSEFVILDVKGKFIKNVMVPFQDLNIRDPFPYTIKDGKLYQLVDNVKTEEWELHVHDIK